MWISGLRGAMAYALALKCAVELELGPVILIVTLLYAFITILGVGSVLHPILTWADVKRKPVDPEAALEHYESQ
jgi:NhaP-type Na+/H+ or K+/H+ antiporter